MRPDNVSNAVSAANQAPPSGSGFTLLRWCFGSFFNASLFLFEGEGLLFRTHTHTYTHKKKRSLTGKSGIGDASLRKGTDIDLAAPTHMLTNTHVHLRSTPNMCAALLPVLITSFFFAFLPPPLHLRVLCCCHHRRPTLILLSPTHTHTKQQQHVCPFEQQ
jgi:hypothetical protein